MDPTVRLLRVIALLQQRHVWSSEELASRLKVDRRTIRRDVTRLRELGYAVDATTGRGGGYSLRAGSALPPLVLSDEEAVLLAAGLRMATVTGVAGAGETAVSALTKLEDLLPARLRARVAALGTDVVSLAGPAASAADPAVLAVLALACHRGERVALGYTDSRGVTSRRDVAPHRLVHAEHRWYLAALDIRRGVWRTFRVDRVDEAELLGGRVDLGEAPDAAAMVAEAVTTAVYTWRASIRLELPLEHAARLVPPTVGQLRAEAPATTLLRIGADDLDWLARYLIGLTCGFEVLEPPELVAALRRVGRELATTGARVGPGGQR
jgi:predicted DNA-binding transcriptional regulator YafY